ncbi:MAG: serine aminopeptidase domain-containing protein [Actinomycetota bacterium]
MATRTDRETSITESVGFLDLEPGSDRIFGCFTMPRGAPTGCAVITPSLFAENARTYRREVILARALAARGIASLRFHYRGTGYSDGDPAALSFPSMCADAEAAAVRLQARCVGAPIAYVGTRLGAVVTASAARKTPGAPMLLWDPVPSGAEFLHDAAKARRAGGMVADRQHGDTAVDAADPWASGFLDSLGYRIPVGLRDSLEGVTLADRLGSDPRPILVLTMVPAYEPNPIAMEAASGCAAQGSEVEVRRIEGRLSWWTSRDSWDPDEEHPPTREVIERSGTWLVRQLGEARSP